MKERRKFPRLKDKLIIYIDSETGLGVKETGESVDISAGGIRVCVPSEFTAGDLIAMEINLLTDSIPITTKGKVLWVKENPYREANEMKYIIGIQFMNLEHLDSDYLERISEYVSITLKKAE